MDGEYLKEANEHKERMIHLYDTLRLSSKIYFSAILQLIGIKK